MYIIIKFTFAVNTSFQIRMALTLYASAIAA